MCLEVIGPTMPDMKDRLGVTYSEIGTTLVCRSVGILIGTLVGGYVLEIFR
jgi:FHS family Na+ dependent glucose MFS transporter 1